MIFYLKNHSYSYDSKKYAFISNGSPLVGLQWMLNELAVGAKWRKN
jgi:hypothetical protein